MDRTTHNAGPGAKRIALIGYGALGQTIASAVESGQLPGVAFQGALIQPGSAQPANRPSWLTVEDMLAASPDLVVEVAGHGALASHAAPCLMAGRNVVVASVGALTDAALRGALLDAARRGGTRLIVPAGALGGLDYVRAARRVGALEVRYRGRKPVHAWHGTHAEELVDLRAIREATTFFRGTAFEAAARFPQNANVVAALALAVGNPDAVRVELVADPGVQRNIHEVEAHGDAGSIRVAVENTALPANPKTSRITAFSILDAIASYFGTEGL